MADSPIDEVLQAARAALLARRADAADRVARIKAAADAYLHAVEHELAAQFAARHGLEYPAPASQAVRAALDLRSAVDALPEAHVRPAGSPSIPPPTARASVPPGEPRVPRDARLDTALAPATEDFLREVRAANLDEMPSDLFRAHAEEFAARARHLQDLFTDRPGDVDALGRVIRTLTAMVSKRGLAGIYGLSRSHSANWQARAEEAARKRQRLLSIPPGVPPPAGVPSEAGDVALAIGENGEAGGGRISTAPDDDEPTGESSNAPSDSLELPHLATASADRAVVIVGGSVKQDKLERLRARVAVPLEWVGVDHAGTHAIAALEKRVREGRVAAIVLLQELVAHKHVEPLLDAARQVGLPWVYGRRAGTATLERALKELDANLGRRAAADAHT